MQERERNGSMDLLGWLVEMGQHDREQYRVLRALMWSMFVDNSAERSRRSDIPSNCS